MIYFQNPYSTQKLVTISVDQIDFMFEFLFRTRIVNSGAIQKLVAFLL